MALEKRQKILLPLIILAFIYILWQVYDIFFAGGSSRPQKQAKPAVSKQAALRETSTSGVEGAPSASLPSSTGATNELVKRPAASKIETPPLTEEQSDYLKLMNRYNLLKLKHLLLEEEAAIAAAKQKIAASRSETAKLTGGADWFEENDSFDLGGGQENYKLVYIDYQNGRWSALLSKAGHYNEVYSGSQMTDGTKIIRVSKKGVTLHRNKKTLLLSFDGMRVLSTDKKEQHENTPLNPVDQEEHYSAGEDKVMTHKEEAAHLSSHKEEEKAVIKPHIISKPDNDSHTGNDTKVAPSKAKPQSTRSDVFPETKPEEEESSKQAREVDVISIPDQPKPKATPEALPPSSPTDELKLPEPAKKAAPQEKEATPSTPSTSQGLFKKTSDVKPAFLKKEEGIQLNEKEQKAYQQVKATLDKKNKSTQLIAQEQEPKVAKKTIKQDEKELLSLSKHDYTLQILGMSDKKDLEEFIQSNQLESNHSYIFETRYLGKQWYILVYGNYKSYDEGLEAIKSLPSSVRVLRPWVRSLIGVQNAIKQNRNT